MEIKHLNFHYFVYVLFCSSCIFTVVAVEGDAVNKSHHHQHQRHHRSMKLFVFGDSYADTGNWDKSAASWKVPYGITVPGRPSGRFSDGLVLTDYIASFLRIKSPVPFAQRETANNSDLQFGMNFAYGGTGVFDTMVNAPNMTTQINIFQQLLLEEKVYTKHDLNSSIAVVSLAGNDYGTHLGRDGNLQDLPGLTKSIVNQLSVNLERIRQLGIKRVAVTALPPLGCLPVFAALSSYQNCSENSNAAAKFHNQMLQKAVQNLNNGTEKHVFHILDLFTAFDFVLKKAHISDSSSSGSVLKSPMQPCCVGVTSSYACGNTDKRTGAKKYVVCNDTNAFVFWDTIHPSQNGWHQIYFALISSLHQLL